MKEIVKQFWESYAPTFLQYSPQPIEIQIAPGITEDDILQELTGSVEGKRVLEIGCGAAKCSIGFARRGALATGIDIAHAQIEIAERLVAENGVNVDLIQGDMSDLSPVGADSQDIVFSSAAVFYVDDLDVCCKEVFRVLKPGGLFVFSVGHPFSRVIPKEDELDEFEKLAFADYRDFCARFLNSYFDTGPKISGEVGDQFAQFDRKVSDYFDDLVGAGFVVERIWEPEEELPSPPRPTWGQTAERLAKVPNTIVFKSRKPSC